MNEDVFNLGVKAIIKNKENKILLLQINKQELIGENNAYWDIPGGRIKKGQSVEETLRNEIQEETGLDKVKIIEKLTMVLSNIRIPTRDGSDVGLILLVYLCELENADKIILSKEHVKYDWFRPKEASKLLEYKYPKEFTQTMLEKAGQTLWFR